MVIPSAGSTRIMNNSAAQSDEILILCMGRIREDESASSLKLSVPIHLKQSFMNPDLTFLLDVNKEAFDFRPRVCHDRPHEVQSLIVPWIWLRSSRLLDSSP
jgi:hypothetical protein